MGRRRLRPTRPPFSQLACGSAYQPPVFGITTPAGEIRLNLDEVKFLIEVAQDWLDHLPCWDGYGAD